MRLRSLDEDESLESAWDEMVFTEARLKGEQEARDFVDLVASLITRLDEARAGQAGARREEVAAHAAVSAADDALDDGVRAIDRALADAERGNRKSARYKRYFGGPPSTYTRLGLESELSRVRGWVASLTSEPEQGLKDLATRLRCRHQAGRRRPRAAPQGGCRPQRSRRSHRHPAHRRHQRRPRLPLRQPRRTRPQGAPARRLARPLLPPRLARPAGGGGGNAPHPVACGPDSRRHAGIGRSQGERPRAIPVCAPARVVPAPRISPAPGRPPEAPLGDPQRGSTPFVSMQRGRHRQPRGASRRARRRLELRLCAAALGESALQVWLTSTIYGTSAGKAMTSLSASQARANLFKLMEQAADSHEPIQINGRHRSSVLAAVDPRHAGVDPQRSQDACRED